MVIAIEDNGEGMAEDDFRQLTRNLEQLGDDMETTGLVNVHRRLKLRYGAEGGLQLTNAPGSGFKVEIFIPRERQDADV
ncbi:hypothetical protein NNL21_35080 [Paenibacillus mendelii]|nr:ATP-binding protein [Paenibacillus mendelii]MCQ6563894.1 hypothetical protein [Paenibacillus mendelii]